MEGGKGDTTAVLLDPGPGFNPWTDGRGRKFKIDSIVSN